MQPTVKPFNFANVATQTRREPKGMPARADMESDCVDSGSVGLCLTDGMFIDLQEQGIPCALSVPGLVPSDSLGFRAALFASANSVLIDA